VQQFSYAFIKLVLLVEYAENNYGQKDKRCSLLYGRFETSERNMVSIQERLRI